MQRISIHIRACLVLFYIIRKYNLQNQIQTDAGFSGTYMYMVEIKSNFKGYDTLLTEKLKI